MTKTVAAGPVLAGDPVTYTITVSNAGPSDAQTVALSDLVPANTTFVSDAQTSGPAFNLTSPAVGGTGTISGTIGTLASGDSATFTVVVMVSPGTPDGTTITNTADVTAATTDPNLANNSATVTTGSVAATGADVSVTNTSHGRPPYSRAHAVSYTITVANAGPDDAQNVAASGLVPANTTFVSVAADLGTGVHSHQSRPGRHRHDHRDDRHAGLGRLGDLHRGGPGIAEHAGRNDDHQHGRA